MPTVRTEMTSDFTAVHVIADSSTMNTDYPVLEVYKNGVLKYTLVVSGSSTIGSVTYTTTAGCTNLDFTSVTTTNGTEYKFVVTPTVLGLTDLHIPDGVYTFKLLDATTTADIYNSNVAYYLLNCCMAKKLNDAYATSMANLINSAELEVVQIHALVESSIASTVINDPTNATKKFAIAEKICSNCGCI